MKKPNTPLSPRQKISCINAALCSVETMHGSVFGGPSCMHLVEVADCKCEYGNTTRGLRSMRREAYAQITRAKR